MSAKWEKQEGNEGILTFEVSAEEFDKALDQAFKKVRRDLQIPGFRKGKIPRKIFDARFGVESLYQDAIDLVLQDAYANAVQETGIEPIHQPEVDLEQIEQGKPVIFTSKVQVKPEVTLGEYKGLEVEKQDIEVSDEDVEEEIKQLQERHAELVVKEEGAIEEGDTAVIDFEGFIGEEAFEGGKGENHSLEIGSGQFIPGFEEELVGKESGEETEVNVTFPEDYHAEDLAGKEAVFKVKIHEVKYKELPALDDEFAKDVDEEAETLEELKDKKRKELEEQRKTEAENKTRQEVIDKAAENAEVDIPEIMVENELEQMIREFEQNLQMQGMTMEMYAQFTGQDEDTLKEEMKEDAAKRIKSSLTLETIAKVENIEPTEEDVNEELDKMASMYGIEKDQIVQMLGGSTETIKGDLKNSKAVDFLVENSKIV